METQFTTPPPHPQLASDLLRGADQIAEYIFGHARERRKVYHLAETSRLPVFRLGAVLCARRSVLLDWIERQERRARSADADATEGKAREATKQGL